MLLCGCSSAVLPDPVQYAVSEETGAGQEAQDVPEVELKAKQAEFPSVTEAPAIPLPAEAAGTDTDVSGTESQDVHETVSPLPPQQTESPEHDAVQPEGDAGAAEEMPIPEPVRTVVADSTAEKTETPEPEPTAVPTPKPTKTPAPKPTASPTPKPAKTPASTPGRESEYVPVVVREESPSPEAETTPAPSPTAIPVTPTPTVTPTTVDVYELAARVAFFEAGSEEGRKAVLSVLFNRCNSSAFGGKKTDIPTEVYRKNQFSVVRREDFLTASVPKSLVDTARHIFLEGGSVLPDNVVFFRVASRGTEWGDKIYYDTIGGNCFFAPAE